MRMKLRDFKTALTMHPKKNLCLLLPGGDRIPADFHITEVGFVSKSFVDCGGTKRATNACVLQAWVARNDQDHRLTAGKLASILGLARDLLPSEELDVEIEYEGCVISQYPVLAANEVGAELAFTLGNKHTDCLAKEACGLESCGCGPADEACP